MTLGEIDKWLRYTQDREHFTERLACIAAWRTGYACMHAIGAAMSKGATYPGLLEMFPDPQAEKQVEGPDDWAQQRSEMVAEINASIRS